MFYILGGGVVGVRLRGVSLFVSRMLLPSFVFSPSKLKSPLAYAYVRGIVRPTQRTHSGCPVSPLNH